VKFLLDHDVPDDLSYLLEELNHEVTFLRDALPGNTSDEAVVKFARERGCVLLTCNRNDSLDLATARPHLGIVIIIRRRTRADERGCIISPAGTCWRHWSPKQRKLCLIDGDTSAEFWTSGATHGLSHPTLKPI